MTNKETLFFIAKCLTIPLESKNKSIVKNYLKLKKINWDAVVKLSTAHYVFPALYCNLKRSNFLKYLPKELVSYMHYITNLNRERNKEIITQAKEINNLLLSNNITPIFLKGTGNLLANLYENIAERMVGDIDFILSKNDYKVAIGILRKHGYSEVQKKLYYAPDDKRHYRRLKKTNSIAAIEIHSELLAKKKYREEFNYNFINQDSQIIKGFTVLSFKNKLNLSIISNQINDNGFYYRKLVLRNAYDVFLLSKKTKAKNAVSTFDKLNHSSNCFLAACFQVFNKVDSLKYNKNNKVNLYLRSFNNQLNKQTKAKFRSIELYIFIKRSLFIIYMAFLSKEYRLFLFKCLTDKNWYKEKMIQLGIKGSN